MKDKQRNELGELLKDLATEGAIAKLRKADQDIDRIEQKLADGDAALRTHLAPTKEHGDDE